MNSRRFDIEIQRILELRFALKNGIVFALTGTYLYSLKISPYLIKNIQWN